MGYESKIGWTRHTANLWWGCVEVSPACDNCYAREWAKRYDRAKWGADEPRLSIKSVWKDLQKFQREAQAANRIDNVFVGSMMDIFEKPMPVITAKGELIDGITTGTLRDGFFNEVVPASPNLLLLLLTKRPQNIAKFVPTSWLVPPPHNVMYGASAGTQREIEKSAAALMEIPGRHFLSIEPLLEYPNLYNAGAMQMDWIICGCESRGKAAGRFQDKYEMAVQSMIEECWNYHVPFFHKQMPVNGEVSHDPTEWPQWARRQQFPTRVLR